MGFYIRKSKDIGNIRINFSKSGIGFSTGVKGFRIGTGPNGNYIHMGKDGIYYKKQWGKKSNRNKIKNNNVIENATEVEEIESGNADEIVDSSSEELVNELNGKRKKFSLKWLSILPIFMPIDTETGLLIFLILLLIFHIMDTKRKETTIYYDIDKEKEKQIEQFYDSFHDIVKSKKQWHIKSRINNYNIKASYGGAGSTVNKQEIKIQCKLPPNVNSNVKSICIPVGKQKLYFFPDKILIYGRRSVGGLDYSNLNVISSSSNFIWSNIIKPWDSEVSYYTYAHVNLNGTPDRRFASNPQIPVLNFTKIKFYSDNGLNEEILLSKPNAGEKLKMELDKIKYSTSTKYKPSTDNKEISNTKIKHTKKDNLKDKVEYINRIMYIMEENDFGYRVFARKYGGDYEAEEEIRDIYKMCIFNFISYIVSGKLQKTDFEIIKKYIGTDFLSVHIEDENVFNMAVGEKFKNEKMEPLDWYCLYMQSNDLIENKLLEDGNENVVDTVIEIYKEVGQKIVQSGYDKEKRRKRYNEYIDYCIKNLENLKQKIKDAVEQEHETNTQAEDMQTDNIEAEETLEELIEQLNHLIGLEHVKNDVNSLINLVKVRKIREEKQIKQEAMSLHLVFSGNPGTGKTTVARLISKIYYKMGVLSKGIFVEADRSELVGGYVGQTALKVKEVCNKAIGGVLFIDEAYSLSNNKDSSDYGKEAIETLLKFMEDHRDNFIVIVAGYTDLMEEFLDINPGLKSRFNKYIHFSDYTPEELLKIYEKLCNDSEMKLSIEAKQHVKEFFEQRYNNRTENFANARDVRNFFEKTLVNQANRIAEDNVITNEELQTVELQDVINIKLKL